MAALGYIGPPSAITDRMEKEFDRVVFLASLRDMLPPIPAERTVDVIVLDRDPIQLGRDLQVAPLLDPATPLVIISSGTELAMVEAQVGTTPLGRTDLTIVAPDVPDDVVSAIGDALRRSEQIRRTDRVLAAFEARLHGAARATPRIVRPMDETARNAPVGLVTVDTRGVVLDLNQSALDVLGGTEADAAGSYLIDFFDARDDVRGLLNAAFDAVDTPARGPSQIVVEHIHGGDPRSVRLAAVACHDEASDQIVGIVSLQDATEYVAVRRGLSRARHRLEQEADQHRLAVETTGFGTFEHDPRSDTILGSPQMQWLHGFPRGARALTVDAYLEHLHPEEGPVLRDLISDAERTGAKVEASYRVQLADGGIRWIRTAARAAPDGRGEVRKVLGVSQDVTARVAADEALRRSLVAERQVSAHLRVVDDHRAMIARALAHDVRGYLTAIGGFAETLRDPRVSETVRPGLLARLSHSVNEMQDLVLKLLEIDQQFDVVGDIASEEIDVTELGRRAVKRVCKSVSPSPKVVVRGGSVLFRSSPTLIERVVENLVRNAVEHSDGAPIRVEVSAVSEGVEIVVVDRGSGVPDALKQKVFAPFWRGTVSAGGRGIGLALVAQIAAFHGGTAWVEDAAGGGAAFHVRLDHRPLAASERTTSGPEAANEPDARDAATEPDGPLR